MNVKMVDKHGQEVMITFRCPLANQAEKLIGHYENIVEQLLGIGWQPLKAGVRTAAPANGASEGAAPMCRVHGVAMKPSRRPGSFFCSKKVGDGYCQEKVG